MSIFFFERRQDEDHDFSFGQRLMSDKKNLKVPDESVDVEVVCQEKSFGTSILENLKEKIIIFGDPDGFSLLSRSLTTIRP